MHPTPRGPARAVSLVVPCYNEAARLDVGAFAQLLAARADVGLVFVDDGSTDATGDVLATFARRHGGRADVVRLAGNAGKGEAVRRGMLHALGRDAAYVGFWDADLATPLAALPEFIAVLDGSPRCQWVFGARVQLLGRRIGRRATRHYAGRVFATAASVVLGLPVYDTQCGAKLFRATPALRECLAAPFRSRWVFDVELLARFQAATGADARAIGELVQEYPLREWTDVRGSKVTGAAFLRAALDLWGIYREYRPARGLAAARARRAPRAPGQGGA